LQLTDGSEKFKVRDEYVSSPEDEVEQDSDLAETQLTDGSEKFKVRDEYVSSPEDEVEQDSDHAEMQLTPTLSFEERESSE
jgi:hypothetical protein